MQGHFDVFVKESGGLCDEDFIAAQREGRLSELLRSLPTSKKVSTDNLVFHDFAIMAMRQTMQHGFPNGAANMDRVAGCPLHHITVLNNASEPSYTEWYAYYGTIHNPSYSVNTGNAGKRFVGYSIDLIVDKDPTGREAIFHRSRWLYLPSQIVSNEIRSIGVYWGEYINDGNEDKQSTARVRLKDSGGNPITLTKSSSQTLLVQYTFSLVSL